MSGDSSSNRDVDIDLGRLMVAIWEKKGRIAVATLLAGGLAFAASSVMAPNYKGEARLLIESRSAPLGASERTGATSEQLLDALNIASQTQILQSVDLIKQVARDMKLYEVEEFDPGANPSVVSGVLVKLGLKTNPLDVAPEEWVIKAFQEKLQVYQVEASRVIAVEFSSKDPVLAAKIPNEMLKVYLSLQSGAKLDANSEAAGWLEPEIANLREKVREADKKVADYRSSADLLRVGENNTFASQQLSDVSTEMARVRADKASAEARAENVRTAIASGRPVDTLADVVGSQMIQRLKETEAAIQGQISDQTTSLMEGHPRLKGLRGQLEGIRGQIASETRKILASLENEANVARLREGQLIQQLNVLKSDSARAGDEEVGLNALEREAAAQRQLLETYLARYREAASRMEGNSSPADARVISTAVEPREPYFPKVGPIVIVASLATLLLSCIIVMLTELFSGRALKPVGQPAIRVLEDAPPVQPPAQKEEIAEMSPADNIVLAAAPAEPVAVMAHVIEPIVDEAETAVEIETADEVVDEIVEDAGEDDDFTIDATAELLASRAAGPTVVAISPTGDDGSTATVMLARAIAGMGRSVVLIDLTASACPTRLMAQDATLPGITDLLAGEAAFGETIHHDRLSSAHIVPHGNTEPQRAMRAMDRLTMVISALSDAYDTVLVECGSVDIARVSKIFRNMPAEIVLSLPNPDEAMLGSVLSKLEHEGYTQTLLMSGMRHRLAGKRRSAA